MSSSQFSDAYESIKTFQNTILAQKPPRAQMIADIRMMNFKIRPMMGNIAAIDFQNEKLIKTLWSLGKLDEFMRHTLAQIPVDEHEIFARLVNELKGSYQLELSKIQLNGVSGSSSDSLAFEAEIYKDAEVLVN